jgi:phospholipid/cholesterol/gamma-HCH transport system substrate-binding protein
MEYRKNEIRAGVFLLISFTVFAVMVFAVSDIQSLFKQTRDVKVLFSFSDGIEKNAQVRHSGIKVGKVANIRVAPEQGDKVELILSVYTDTAIKVNTKAAIKSLGLVGGKYVELSGGTPDAKPLAQNAVIQGEESLKMEELTKMGMEVVNKLKNVALNIEKIVQNVERTVGDPALSKNIKGAVQNVNEITENVKVMTSNKEQVAETLKNLPDLLKKIDASVANLKEITEKTDKLVGENRKNIDATMENVKEITNNLKEMTDDVKKHPWKLIRKP